MATTTAVDNSIIDDFELNDLSNWETTNNVTLSLSNSNSNSGEQSLFISYDNTTAPYYSEISLTFDDSVNYTKEDFKILSLSVFNTSVYEGDEFSIALIGSGWGYNYSAINYPIPSQGEWTTIQIDVDDFADNNTSLNLSSISGISLIFGNKLNPVTGTEGNLYLDDILILPTGCTNNADTNDDCITDISDLTILADDWLTTNSVADFDGSASIDMADMGLLAYQWQKDGSIPQDDVIGGISGVPFTEVSFNDNFWKPRLEINRTATVPYIFSKLEEKGRIENFAIAGGLSTATPQYDFPFDDTDIYKTLEGASYSLMVSPDPELEQYLDELIVLIAAAQEDDGYLYTIRTNGMNIWSGTSRWSNLSMSHELYDAGHLIEAAIAHYQATGKTSLLNVARKFADLLVDLFHDGGIEIPPGHEIVESALARLAHVTGDNRYLELARYFIDIRGTVTDDYSPWGQYHQDHIPVLDQTEAVGHVVRALYLYMGMADVAKYIDDSEYSDALMSVLDKIWHSVNDTKAYITGGLGAEEGGESFGSAYHLPNDGYCETCAQIANVMWNQRMFLHYRDGKYIDVLERSLYNSVISGVSFDGTKFFYPNPLESSGGYTRSGWFACNCCIGNIARTIPSVPGYVYCQSGDEIYVNLYVQSSANIELDNTSVELFQTGNYPWDGNMTLTVNPSVSSDFCVYIRIPGWARNNPVPSDLYQYENQSQETASIAVNDELVDMKIKKGYVKISRKWQPGDIISVTLPMSVRKVLSHPSIAADVDHIAIERGPIVYCAEWPDQATQNLTHMYLPENTVFTTEYKADMIGLTEYSDIGNIITANIKGVYENESGGIDEADELLTAIPYYAWAHRGEGPMAVWLANTAESATPIPLPTPEQILGYWNLDESTGTLASDSSGNGNNGTLLNGITFDSNSTQGAINTALQFDGTDDYISVPAGFSDFSKGCTISLWTHPTAVQSWARFIDFGNGSAADNIWFGRNSSTSNLTFECWNNGTVTATNAIELDQWQMFTVAVSSSGSAKIYKNGQIIASGSCTVTSISRNNNYIGKSNWSGDDYYEGAMDEIRIYNYELTSTEVMQLYNLQ